MSLRARYTILACVLLWAVWYIVPTIRNTQLPTDERIENEKVWRQEETDEPDLPAGAALSRTMTRWWGGDSLRAITLGLDLQGGMHLRMQVDIDEVITNEIARQQSAVETAAQAAKLAVNMELVGQALTVTCEPAISDQVEELLDEAVGGGVNVSGGGGNFRIAMPQAEREALASLTVRQAVETMRRRLFELGITEPVLVREGRDRLLIQLPGVNDPQRILDLLTTTASLDLAQVYDEKPTEAEIKRALGYRIPSNRRLLKGTQTNLTYDVEQEMYYLVDRSPVITGADLEDARVSQGQLGDYVVSFSVASDAASRLGRWTGSHIGTDLAIILDDEVISAPRVQDRISHSGIITGDFSFDEAEELAVLLRAGALPASLDIIEQRTIGPTLGADSVSAGVQASLIGLAVVLVFMVLYYRLAGVIAVCALVLNLLLVLAAMAAFRATLTVPGIAGLILTVGMSVDANVLIFERIREETDKGKTLRTAVEAAFEKVTLTILDANITTLVTALVLFQFGTGPVKGFAVTLSIGIICSLYTALIGTRMALDTLLRNPKVNKLAMTRLLGNTHVPFTSVRRIALAASVILLAVGGIRTAQRGQANLGVDFAPGTLVQARVTPSPGIGPVRDALEAGEIENPTVQTVGADAGEEESFLIRTSAESGGGHSGEAVAQALSAAFGTDEGGGVTILRTEEVGAAVSEDLTRQAMLALIYSIGAIILYISVRFEFRFAICAVIALLHDLGITIGMFALTGREISLPVVAALLTVVGYSLNDTIVVFDRIRERQKLMRNASFMEVLNTSVNETLSRTLLTSVTTLLVVLILYFFGGSVIHDFAFALIVGVLVGTYSSIFVASMVLLEWQIRWPQEWRGPALDADALSTAQN